MLFKDWRLCPQNLVDIKLEKNKFYYMQARAWHLKGYMGGTHSYSVVYSEHHQKFLVVELSDYETVQHQNCNIIYMGKETIDRSKHCVLVTDRAFNAQWFGSNPYIVDSCHGINYSDVMGVLDSYPINEFKLIGANCNTFTSYLHYILNCNVQIPLKSIGYKTKTWWRKKYGT